MVPMASVLRQKNPAGGGLFGDSGIRRGRAAWPWSLCGSRGWRWLRRLGPVPKPPQEAERALAHDPAPEQGRAGDCEDRRQLAAGEGLADYGMKRPEDNGWRQRSGADRQQVPATLASGQRPTR